MKIVQCNVARILEIKAYIEPTRYFWVNSLYNLYVA